MNVKMHIITEDNVDQLLSMSYSNNIHKLTKSNEPTEVLLKNLWGNIQKELKEYKPRITKYESPTSEEFIPVSDSNTTPEFSPGNAPSPEYAQELLDLNAPINQSPSFLQSLTQSLGLEQQPQQLEQQPQQLQQNIPYTPIVQEFGKSSTESEVVETPQTEQTILEVETEKTQTNEENNEGESTEKDVNNESTENKSEDGTKKIITL
jgi:hypothetical protein